MSTVLCDMFVIICIVSSFKSFSSFLFIVKKTDKMLRFSFFSNKSSTCIVLKRHLILSLSIRRKCSKSRMTMTDACTCARFPPCRKQTKYFRYAPEKMKEILRTDIDERENPIEDFKQYFPSIVVLISRWKRSDLDYWLVVNFRYDGTGSRRVSCR